MLGGGQPPAAASVECPLPGDEEELQTGAAMRGGVRLKSLKPGRYRVLGAEPSEQGEAAEVEALAGKAARVTGGI